MRRFRWYRRLRRRVPVFWFVSVVLAGLTGLMVFELVSSAAASASRYGSLVSVPVVARPVSAGAVVGRSDVAWRPVPRAFLPAASLVARDPVGRAAVVALVPGEVVVQSRLAPFGLRGAAALVPAGWRALAVPLGDASLALRRGDRVDVLATAETTTSVAAHNALVVDVAADHSSATVAVSADDSPAVASALAGGTVTLALLGGATP